VSTSPRVIAAAAAAAAINATSHHKHWNAGVRLARLPKYGDAKSSVQLIRHALDMLTTDQLQVIILYASEDRDAGGRSKQQQQQQQIVQ